MVKKFVAVALTAMIVTGASSIMVQGNTFEDRVLVPANSANWGSTALRPTAGSTSWSQVASPARNMSGRIRLGNAGATTSAQSYNAGTADIKHFTHSAPRGTNIRFELRGNTTVQTNVVTMTFWRP